MAVALDYTEFDKTAARLCCASLAQEPMARHTTFQIGGPADRLVTAENPAQLGALLAAAKEAGLPVLLLGRGSDLLVGDRGIRGIVLRLAGDFQKITPLPDGVSLRAGAGVSLAALCAYARERELSGLEFAWGIPGSVGGAVYMNAGAYGGEMKDAVTLTKHLDSRFGPGEYQGEALDFSYRHSAYTGTDKIITFAQFRLAPGDREAIGAKMEALMARRKEKQPYDMPSAGSVFKRPAVGYAAALIDQCGLKGRSVGGAQVSEKHGGFIVNTGGATCRDVLALMELIQDTVRRQTGTELEPEVRVTGEG